MEAEEVRSRSAMGDRLERVGKGGGIEGMEKVNDEITKKVSKRDDRGPSWSPNGARIAFLGILMPPK